MTHGQTSEMLLGALVADAACLGVHWIYDADRIAEIAARQGGRSVFTPIDAANYEGVRSNFVHGVRHDGMLTQYGEVLRLAIQTMNAHDGRFDAEAYAKAFAAFFGPGGAYQGYIDRPTRGALRNIADGRFPSGIDDDQNPAIATLPAILAGYHGRADLFETITTAMQITNVNDVAAAYSVTFAAVLVEVMQDRPVGDALEMAAQDASPLIRDDLMSALADSDANTTDFAGRVGRACHLPTSGPVMAHILKHSNSYADAVERNALAGGDNAGRSLMIGAVMARAHGLGTSAGIPLAWILRLDDGARIWAECERLGRV